MRRILSLLSLATILALTITSCKKDSTTDTPSSVSNSQVLNSFSDNVSNAIYSDLAGKASSLNTSILTLANDPTDANLDACKQLWKETRLSWEQSEAFLFGPVATENIDPRIDTWPVNFTSLDSIIADTVQFTEAYIDNLEDALKGFHPIEYFLFGQNGNKTAAELTPRELDYLKALALNLKQLTQQVADSWNPAEDANYYDEFTTAGNGSTVYPTKQAAFEEMVNAMAGICEEVAGGKMSEPFVLQDPSLEESPYAKNSITDFTNNIKGVENVYLGKYMVDGAGLEDFIRKYNLSLDGEIKAKISAAINALNQITVPFGEAIITQQVQVQNAIDAINELKEVLESDELLVLVQQHSNQ
jgi:putative iron-regulated protein